MSRLYRTKNAMFYTRTRMTDELKILMEKHQAKYGQSPKRIYTTGTEWDLYEQELSPPLRHSYSECGYPRINLSQRLPPTGEVGIVAMTFQGIPVVRREDWRKLIRKK